MKTKVIFSRLAVVALPILATLQAATVVAQSAIGDFVWEDLNRNGLQNAGEPGISNVPVLLLDCFGAVLATTSTAANGYYFFTSLPSSAYLVRFVPPGGYQFTVANTGNDALDSDANPTTGFTACYALAPGETNRTVDAGLFRPAALGDFVWEDRNTNGTRNAGEPGIPNVPVQLLDCLGNVVATTSTDANGLYVFSGLLPSTYMVRFQPPAGHLFTLANTGDDTLDSDANPATGLTICYTLLSGQTNLTVNAGLIQNRPRLTAPSFPGIEGFQFTFINTNATTFTVLATTNAGLPPPDWETLGPPTPLGNGVYRFTDPAVTNSPRRFYRLRSL